MKTVFLDTGYIIALEAADDQHHNAALRHWKTLSIPAFRFVMTSYIFDEVVTFFNSQHQHAKAVEIGNRLMASPSVQLVHVDEPLFDDGWQYFVRHSDKTYSLTDCISFVLMGKYKIKTAFAFDKHFVQAGFEKIPE